MKKIMIILLLVFCILFINNDRVDSRNKNIYYDNFRYTNNVDFNDMFDYHAYLVNVGDYYEIEFDVINGTGDSYEIKNLNINESDEYFSYELRYLDDKKVSIGDKLNGNSKVSMKYRVEYKKSIENNRDTDSSFGLEYGQIF